MTRDVAAQAVHERLEHLAAAMPQPDLDAGWAALAAQLEPPVAPVIPFRRPRHRRAVILGVAAAMLIAGGAFAMVRPGADQAKGAADHTATAAPTLLRLGPHAHPPFAGPPADDRSGGPNPVDSDRDGGSGSADDPSTGAPGAPGDTSSGSSHHGGTHAFHHDAADDTDHGTGNDGSHDDNGKGNDANGQDPQDTGGGGPSAGAGSAGGQATGRGTHGAPAGSGSAAAGQDQGGGHGPNA